MIDSFNQGGTKGPTVGAYRKGIDVMAEKADVDIKLLAIPGLRDPAITDYAIDATEERFDAMYIMDIEERDDQNDVIIDRAAQKPNVTNTVGDLQGRNLDTSFAAAYYPDVVITDPRTQTNVVCAPSVAVLGAFSLNDSVAHPWFAPAGFTRGALKSVIESQVKVNRANLDALYEADINPISAFPHTPGVVVWGQKTLQAAKSALDRVNVRRLLIEVRRQVKRVGNTLLFEPNREETLARFSAAVNPILQRIQAQQGLDRFKVIIDTTTTTQADVENNTVRGKIFLQPTRTVEFISLDFVVTNAGMEV
jgi:phage tail sheath protein FI